MAVKLTKVDRLESGIPGLDNLIEGGFVRGSTNLLAGQTGTGKTIMGIQFILQGLKNGENGVYLSLEQKGEDLLADVSRFGWDTEIKKYQAAGKLELVTSTPTGIKDLQTEAMSHLRKVKAQRFVLDSLSIATMSWKVSSMDVGKIRSEIFDFLKMLKSIGVTSLLITEIPESEEKKLSRFGFEEFLADGIVRLHYIGIGTEEFTNLEIRKMRRTDHAKGLFPVNFTKNGLKVIGKRVVSIR